MWKAFAIATAVLGGVVATCGVLCLALVVDWFAPSSPLTAWHLIATHYSTLTSRIDDVFGMFLIRQRRGETGRFPFLLKLGPDRSGRRDAGTAVRARFQGKTSAATFAFNDDDWAMLRCWSPPTPVIAAESVNARLRLGPADACLVRWRRGEPKTMLVGAITADGGRWVRFLAPRICRTLAAAWLDSAAVEMPDEGADYAGCLLVHDPDHAAEGAATTVAAQLFEIHPGRTLARID